jgi:hypothetical protein
MSEKKNELKKRIKEINGEFCVLSESTDRNFGCYPNRDAAETRLRQIERFKKFDCDQDSIADLICKIENLPEDQINDALIAFESLKKSKDNFDGSSHEFDLCDWNFFGDHYCKICGLTKQEHREKTENNNFYILSKNIEEQYVLGIVLEPNDGEQGSIYLPDTQGDIYSIDEIRQAAFLYMEKFQNTGLNHKSIVNKKIKIVESYLAPTDMSIKGWDGHTYEIQKGTWLLGLHVVDKSIWEKVKSGELNGLSIGGSAKKVPENQS